MNHNFKIFKAQESSIQRCLITGAQGFIGRSLCRLLKDHKYYVRASLRTKILRPLSSDLFHATQHEAQNKISNYAPDEIVYGDLRNLLDKSNQDENLMHDIDTVFHLAGIAHATRNNAITKETYFEVNVDVTENLLHLAGKAGVKRFIYFSSIKASGTSLSQDYYGASKKVAEEKVIELGLRYGIHVCILRPALVYGPGVKGNLASMIQGIARGWFPPLPYIDNKRSMIALQDLVEVALLTAVSPQANGKIYTVTDGHGYSSRALYDEMRHALGKSKTSFYIPYFVFQMAAMLGEKLQSVFKCDLPFNNDKLDKVLGSAFFDNQDLQRELGWKPKLNFSDVISDMVNNKNYNKK